MFTLVCLCVSVQMNESVRITAKENHMFFICNLYKVIFVLTFCQLNWNAN